MAGRNNRRKPVTVSRRNGLLPSLSEELAETPSESEESESLLSEIELKLEDELTNDKLRELEYIFEEADEDGGGGLDMDEFRNAMRQAMGDQLTDHELDLMFMKVDTNCDGTVDWDEYLSYMLLEYREKDQMNFEAKRKPFPIDLKKVPHMNRYQRHSDNIVCLAHQPTVIKATGSNILYRAIEDENGKYISVSKDGIVNFWSMDLKHLKSGKIGSIKKEDESKKTSVWVTALVYISNLNMLAVSTTSCDVTFYGIYPNMIIPLRSITKLEISLTCMDYWTDPTNLAHSILMMGDARGNVYGLEFNACAIACFLNPPRNKKYKQQVPVSEVLSGTHCCVQGYFLSHIHEDFVLRIKWLPEMDCFLSCCRERTCALYFGDLNKKKSAYFKVRKGVFAFDYSKKHSVIVTGGKDTVVRVWNPYVNSNPVMILQGHKSAVTNVLVNELMENIISISEDKEVNIFDMTTQVCIQTIYRKWLVPLGTRPISAVLFNQHRQALLMATNQLALFEHGEREMNSKQLTSHAAGVNVILYSSLFDQVISGGADSMVCVWDITTGKKVIQFSAHRQIHFGEEINIAVTAMKLDPTNRRLVTGARDGTVRIWNYNNGALLRELEVFDKFEVSGIVWDRGRILTAGWNRRIAVYFDSQDDETVAQWKSRHYEDILSLTFVTPSTIASSSFDGDILLWSLETGHLLSRLNGNKVKPPDSDSQNPSGDQPDTKKPVLRYFVGQNEKGPTRMGQNPAEKEPSLASQRPSPSGNTKCDIITSDVSATADSSREVSTDPCQEECEANPVPTSFRGNAKLTEEEREKSMSALGKVVRMKRRAMAARDRGLNMARRSKETSVDKLLFLQTRGTGRESACLVASGAGGWIRFWSVHPDGGMLGGFSATHLKGDAVLAMATDENNQYLITGDTSGYIKVWYIAEYCTEEKPVVNAASTPVTTGGKINGVPSDIHKRFSFLRDITIAQRKLCPSLKETSDKNVNGPPVLINSFRGHLQAITCLEYINGRDYVVSCSSDRSVRLWSVYGQYIGIFGVPWQQLSEDTTKGSKFSMASFALSSADGDKVAQNMMKLPKPRSRDVSKLPSDVRKVASATTLRVMYGGLRPNWKLAKNIVLIWIPMLRHKRKMDLRQFLSMREKNEEKETEIMPSIMDLSFDPKNILGKSFKSNRKHKPLPKLPEVRMFQSQVDAYSSLPCHELAPTDQPCPTPPIVREMRETQKALERHRKMQYGMNKAKNFAKLYKNSRSKGVFPNTQALSRSGGSSLSTSNAKCKGATESISFIPR